MIRRTTQITLEFAAGLMIILVLVAGIGYWRVSQAPLSLGFMRSPLETLIGSGLGNFSVRMQDAIIERAKDTGSFRFSLRNLSVLDESSNVVARAPRATFSISWQAFWDGEIVPSRLALIGPRMVLQRKSDGAIKLGFDVPGETAGAADRPAGKPSTNTVQPTNGKSDAGPDARVVARPESGAARVSDVAAVTAGGGRLIEFIVSSLSADAGQAGSTSYLQDISVRDAELTLFDETNDAIWFAPAANLVFQRVPGGVSFLTDARIGSQSDSWGLQLAAIYRKTSDLVSVTARVSDVVPAALAQKMPILASVAKMRTPLSGEVRVEMKRDGTVLTANALFGAKAGLVDFPGFISQPLLVDEGTIRIGYSIEDGNIIVRDSTIYIGGIQTALNGRFTPVAADDGTIETVNYTFTADSQPPTGAGISEAIIDRLVLEGSANLPDRRLDIDSLYLSAGEAKVLVKGSLRDEGAAPSMRLDAKLSEIPFELLKSLWPPAAAPGARRWLVENLQRANVKAGVLKVDITSDALAASLAGEPLPTDQLDLRLQLDDIAVRYLGELPIIQGGRAQGHLTGDSFDLRVSEGYIEPRDGEPLTLSNGRFLVETLGIAKPPARITFDLSGPTASVMRTIDYQPLNYATRFGLVPETIKGQSKTRFDIRLPLVGDLKLDEVSIQTNAKLSALNMPDVLGESDIEDGNLDLDITKQRMIATGQVKINGVTADLNWNEDFTGTRDYSSEITLSGTMDEEGRKRLSLGIERFVAGPAGFTVLARGPGADIKTVSVQADLTNASLLFKPIGWIKPPGSKASANLEIDLDADGGKSIRKMVIKGEGIDVDGKMELSPNDELTSLNLTRVRLGANAMQVKGSRRENGVLALKLTASDFDARSLMRSMFNDIGTDKRDASASSGRPMEINAQVATVYTNNNATLRNVSTVMRLVDGAVEAMTMKGNFVDGAPLDVTVASQPGGKRVLRATSTNAGEVLRATDLYKNARGGRLRLDATLSPLGQSSGTSGVVRVDNFKVANDATLSRVASQTRRSGGGDNELAFDSLRIPFAVRGDVLDIGDSYVRGLTIGAIAEGSINTTTEVVNISGTFIPAYGLNSILSNVPIVGPVLMGGEGQGLFGITFAVGGTLNKPRFQVNPVSALAPGFLRQLFRIDGSQTRRPSGGVIRQPAGGAIRSTPQRPAGPGR